MKSLMKWEEDENHRKALANRIEYEFLEQEYEGGEGNFPYDAFDLANYLMSLYEE